VSGVVIRCPNCGTTQSTLGECETCHEAGTRYFCTNHEAGRWLDGPACAVCGARYRMEPATSRPTPRTRVEPPVSWAPSSRPIDEPQRVPLDAWSGPVRTPGKDEVFETGPPGVELPDRRTGPAIAAESLTLEATAAGCARRIIVLFLILLVLAALTIFGLLGVGIRLL
jgi:hypothetical protein